MRHQGMLLATLAVALFSVAPSSVAAQGRTVTGTYTTSLTTPQGQLKALIVIKRDNGALSGTLDVEGFPTARIASVTPTDNTVRMIAETPEGPVDVTLKFTDADKVAGTVLYQGAEYPIEGTFVASASGAAGSLPPGRALSTAAGTYSLKTTQPLMGSDAFEVTCTVTRATSGSYGGACGNPEHGEVAVEAVTVAGNTVTITGPTPAGAYTLSLTIAGAAADGTIAVGAEMVKIKGTFAAK